MPDSLEGIKERIRQRNAQPEYIEKNDWVSFQELNAENGRDYYRAVGILLKERFTSFNGIYVGSGFDLVPATEMGGNWTYVDMYYNKESWTSDGIHFIRGDAHTFNSDEPFDVLLDKDGVLLSLHGDIFENEEELLDLFLNPSKYKDVNLGLGIIRRLVRPGGIILTNYKFYDSPTTTPGITPIDLLPDLEPRYLYFCQYTPSL